MFAPNCNNIDTALVLLRELAKIVQNLSKNAQNLSKICTKSFAQKNLYIVQKNLYKNVRTSFFVQIEFWTKKLVQKCARKFFCTLYKTQSFGQEKCSKDPQGQAFFMLCNVCDKVN